MKFFADLRAALFDLDGTLIETHIHFPRMKQAVLALASRFGLNEAELAPLDILGVVEAARYRLEIIGEAEVARQFRKEAFLLLEEIEQRECAHPVAIPGAAELLHQLRRRDVRVGVVTRNCRTVALRLMEFGGLVSDALVTRDDVPRTKPDPIQLFVALQMMGVPIPKSYDDRGGNSILMVGDHWMDVQAGQRAGLQTVGILRGRTADFFAPAMPDVLVNELAELLPLLTGSKTGNSH